MKGKQWHWLGLIRFTAAMVVCIGHVRGSHFVGFAELPPGDKSWLTAIAFALSRLGLEAVIVFFVMSGYLVGGRALQKTVEGSFDLKSYILDRTTRIYIPLIPALGLTGFVAWWCHGHSPPGRDLLINLAGLQNASEHWHVYGGNAPLWSLAYEIWLYVICGASLGIASRNLKSQFNKLAAMVMVTAGLSVLCCLGNPHYSFCWLIGALGANLGAPPRGRASYLLVGMALVAAGVISMQLNSGSVAVSTKTLLAVHPDMPTSTLIVALGSVISIHVLGSWTPRSRLMNQIERSGENMAAFSYTLFLVHSPLLVLWSHYFPGKAASLNLTSIAAFFLKLAAIIFLSWLIYLLFERNTGAIRKWGRTRLFAQT